VIAGCDFHPSRQQVSWLDTETGETGERKLVPASGDPERFSFVLLKEHSFSAISETES